MSDKYETKIEGDYAVVVIPSGPAKGEYRGQFFRGGDGMIKIGNATIGGKDVALKVKPEEMPTLAAWIAEQMVALKARIASEQAQNEIDRQMVRAGFSTGSAIVDREYREVR